MMKSLSRKLIERKTRQCLRQNRYRDGALRRAFASSSNLLFALTAVALMGTMVHGVYQLPADSASLETKIRAGEIITDEEVPVVAEAVRAREIALEKSAQVEINREVRNHALRFGIDNQLARLIYDISVDEKMDPDLVFRIIWTESRFNRNAIGKVGEIGLMQVRYMTAVSIDPGATRKKLFDPSYNIRIGIKHLKDHLHFYRGDRELALLAYNRGRGRVNELLALGLDPANGYAHKVLRSNF